MCIKSEVEEILSKLATNDHCDGGLAVDIKTGELTKIIHQLSSNTLFICSTGCAFIKLVQVFRGGGELDLEEQIKWVFDVK